MNNNYTTVVFDLFGVLFRYKLNNSLLAKGLLSLYIEIGGRHNIFEPIDAGIKLLEKCGAHKRYVLSNVGQSSFATLHTQFPEIFSQFDGIVYSGTAGYSKPDKRIYKYLFDTYHINPDHAVFIDDKKKNVEIAQQLGMIGIVCDDFARVENSLQKHGVI